MCTFGGRDFQSYLTGVAEVIGDRNFYDRFQEAVGQLAAHVDDPEERRRLVEAVSDVAMAWAADAVRTTLDLADFVCQRLPRDEPPTPDAA